MDVASRPKGNVELMKDFVGRSEGVSSRTHNVHAHASTEFMHQQVKILHQQVFTNCVPVRCERSWESGEMSAVASLENQREPRQRRL